VRAAWRAVCMSIFGLGLQRQEFTALASINFAASKGMIGILGPNGAGKTTLLRILSAVLEPSVGTIHYGGRERRKFDRQLPGLIGYLPQSFGLPSHLTAREYLEYFALAYRIGDRDTRKRRIDSLLAEVGLEQRQHEKIREFSGGMRQRVAIARTLLREPPIVIVDEPTVGLDPRERIRLRNLLTQLSAGRIVLFSTHVVEDVAVSCERVIVMKRGAVIYDGRPEELARLAASKVWAVKLREEDAAAFAKGHKVIDQVPEPGGIVRLRVLSQERPHSNAEPLEANLEDGYFELFNRAATS
jgi:ABC-type multidrug transport system ATPase subunit